MIIKRIAVSCLIALFVATCFWSARADDESKPGDTKAVAATDQGDADTKEKKYVPKTKQQLRKTLTPLQYDVTQNEATEPAFRNKYWNNKKDGTYKCIVCDRDLFKSDTKYKSGTGWPSFFAPIDEKHIGLRTDYRLFYARTEVHCSRCNAHLGHVFDDGPQPTGKRFCMNSAALKFIEQEKQSQKSK